MLGRFLLGQAVLDPLLTKVAGRSPSGTDSVSPDPLLTPSKKVQGGFRRAQIPSRPTLILQSNPKTFRGKNPQAMATYVPEVARLTYKAGSNSRLRITERGMTEDEHNRGRGPSPLGGRRIFASRIRDPCGCHASGIPSREAPSPRNLANGSDIHRDCPRVFLRCAHKATSRPLSNGIRTSTWTIFVYHTCWVP